MLKKFVKQTLKTTLHKLGFDIVRIKQNSAQNSTPDMHSFLYDISRLGFDCEYVLDLGAHEGWFTKVAMDIYPNAHYTLFEPLPQMKEKLEKVCQENPKCQYLPLAISNQTGKTYITNYSNLSGASIKRSLDKKLQQEKKQILIDTDTIDNLVLNQKVQVPNLVKMDIEGSELDALQEATSILGKTEVFIIETALYNFGEYRPDFYDIVEFMRSKEYYVYDVVGYHRRPYDGSLGMLDIVFVKDKGTLRSNHKW